MSNLNSVLLEGRIASRPEFQFSGQMCQFAIASTRHYVYNDKLVKEVGYFNIEAWGSLAKLFVDKTNISGIRVVGRLKQEGVKVFIVAESIEFRTIKTETEAQQFSI